MYVCIYIFIYLSISISISIDFLWGDPMTTRPSVGLRNVYLNFVYGARLILRRDILRTINSNFKQIARHADQTVLKSSWQAPACSASVVPSDILPAVLGFFRVVKAGD